MCYGVLCSMQAVFPNPHIAHIYNGPNNIRFVVKTCNQIYKKMSQNIPSLAPYSKSSGVHRALCITVTRRWARSARHMTCPQIHHHTRRKYMLCITRSVHRSSMLVEFMNCFFFFYCRNLEAGKFSVCHTTFFLLIRKVYLKNLFIGY